MSACNKRIYHYTAFFQIFERTSKGLVVMEKIVGNQGDDWKLLQINLRSTATQSVGVFHCMVCKTLAVRVNHCPSIKKKDFNCKHFHSHSKKDNYLSSPIFDCQAST